MEILAPLERITFHSPEGEFYNKTKEVRRDKELIAWMPVHADEIKNVEDVYVRTTSGDRIIGYVHMDILMSSKKYDIFCRINGKPMSDEERMDKIRKYQELRSSK